MAAARMLLCEVSPITQRSASSRLDLPQPFGPTTPVSPGSITSSVGSTKDLKPSSLSRLICISCRSPRCLLVVRSGPLRRYGSYGAPADAVGAAREQRIDHLADLLHRELFLHELAPTKKFGVPMMPSVRPRSLTHLRPSIMALILAAGVKLRARHPHLRGDLEDGVGAHLLGDPGGCCSMNLP